MDVHSIIVGISLGLLINEGIRLYYLWYAWCVGMFESENLIVVNGGKCGGVAGMPAIILD